MTPTSSRLKTQLDERLLWFHNEWFFKWHGIGRESNVKIDTFDGRFAQYSGVGFSGSPRQVFWAAITRGARKEIVEQFKWVDDDVRKYNRATALCAIDECADHLVWFIGKIRREAIEKDRILRGDGINFPAEHDAGRWEGALASDIKAQAEGLKAALPHEILVTVPTIRQRLNAIWNENQWLVGSIGPLITVATLVWALL